jgi:hypothetical protein
VASLRAISAQTIHFRETYASSSIDGPMPPRAVNPVNRKRFCLGGQVVLGRLAFLA